MASGCSIPMPTLVYAWPKKAEFDLLAVPEIIHEWKPCRSTTVLKADGQEWERRCHSKTVEDGEVTVIFQWFDERHATLHGGV